ncbi:MAG TPA: hypothetical protein VLM38_05170 [Blastocatellia bacterium]|nr:hypothetical protein [Blastocatellia bacterium]
MRLISCLAVVIIASAPICRAQLSLPAFSVELVNRSSSKSILRSTAVTNAIARAFAMSGSGTINVEYGFGVIMKANGDFETTPVTRGESGIWRATVPASIIAIFHTHRNEVSPRPSDRDMQESDRLQRPIYVISDRGVWVYEPDPMRRRKGRSSLQQPGGKQ